jgi:hypothetical protein
MAVPPAALALPCLWLYRRLRVEHAAAWLEERPAREGAGWPALLALLALLGYAWSSR